MELFGLEQGSLKTNINDLQAYENHIKKQTLAILFEHRHRV